MSSSATTAASGGNSTTTTTTTAKEQLPAIDVSSTSEFEITIKKRLQENIIADARETVHDNINAFAEYFVHSLMVELRTVLAVVDAEKKKKTEHSSDLDNSVKTVYVKVLNSEESSNTISCKIRNSHHAPSSSTPTTTADHKFHFFELLPAFCDSFLRHHNDDISSSSSFSSSLLSTEEVLDLFGTLFSFIQDKDVFSEHYRLRLANRLRSTKYDEDLESQFLLQLQRWCGKSFVHKLEGMLHDMRNAGTVTQDFNKTKPNLPCDFEVNVLTYAYWPVIAVNTNFVPFDALKLCQNTFEKFYTHKHFSRVLKWTPEVGGSSVTIKVDFPKGVKELTMTIHQASVMLAIDELAPPQSDANKGVSINAIAAKVGLDVEDVKAYVASMLLPKNLNLLVHVKEDSEKEIEEEKKEDHHNDNENALDSASNCFALNPDFATRMKKLKVPKPGLRIVRFGRPPSPPTVPDELRNKMLDAAMVRIMKSRKKVKQSELIDSTIQAVLKYFIALPRQIKLRIDHLMQKEFIERDDEFPEIFHYLA